MLVEKKDFKTTLVAINAKYIHTGLGVRSIYAYVQRETDFEVEFLELTINQHEQAVLESLYERHSAVYLFSCYIWNIEMVERLVGNLRQLRPDAKIGLGGPQVGYRGEQYLATHLEVDFIILGEGEKTVCRLLPLLQEEKSLASCGGIVYREEKSIRVTPGEASMEMDALAFAYPDIGELQHKIIYYESMRGCPFSCSYCLSSVEKGVRKRSLSLVFEDLEKFLSWGVPQVKFVDRTFNCDPKHSRGIWEWLAIHDNGVTNFHFELSGELLDEETLLFLSKMRPGLFQFEIGVQSTNLETLKEIDRFGNVQGLLSRVNSLLVPGNIHVHLDLIAGLPYEGYDSFQNSFRQVYACRPHQLQLGFLKVLSGSKMEKKAVKYGLIYSGSAPYQILANRWLSYQELTELQGIADMVEIYYNSCRFTHIIEHLLSAFSDVFAFYQTLSDHFRKTTEGQPVSRLGYFDVLRSFVLSQGMAFTERMHWLAKYDLLLHEKPRKLPGWMQADISKTYRKSIQGFFMEEENVARYLPEYLGEDSLRIERMAHVEVFPFHPETGAPGRVVAVLNYKQKNILGIAAVKILPMDVLQS